MRLGLRMLILLKMTTSDFCQRGSQCDQIAQLFVQYLTDNKNANLPNSVTNLWMLVQKFAKY